MENSDWIALIALALSAYAMWQSQQVAKSQERLTDREVELVRQQLEKNKIEERNSKTANVSARLYKVAKNDWRLKIFNKGPSIANNVSCSSADIENSMFSASSFSTKLPLAKMEQGDSVEINAFVHLQSPSKETVILTWDDASGSNQSKEVEVTL